MPRRLIRWLVSLALLASPRAWRSPRVAGRHGLRPQNALRFARRTPPLTPLAVVTLALGIGATTAVYTATDAAFFRPLPFEAPQELVQCLSARLRRLSPGQRRFLANEDRA